MNQLPTREAFRVFHEGLTIGIDGELYRPSPVANGTYLDSHGQRVFFQPSYTYGELETGWLESFSHLVDQDIQEVIARAVQNSSVQDILESLPPERKKHADMTKISIALGIIDGFSVPNVLNLEHTKTPKRLLSSGSGADLDVLAQALTVDKLVVAMNESPSYLSERILGAHQDFLCYNGSFYSLQRNGRGGGYPKLFHNGNYYSVAPTEFLEKRRFRELEREFGTHLKTLIEATGNVRFDAPQFQGVEALVEAMLNGEAYYAPKRLGFHASDKGTFVYFLVPSFYLYDRKLESYYRFPEAKVGVKFQGRDGFTEKQYVLNRYSHPALPLFGTDFQALCYDGSTDVGNEHRDIVNSNHGPVQKGRMLLRLGIMDIVTGYKAAGVEHKPIFQNETYYEKYRAEKPADMNLVGNVEIPGR
jgi:hypothetical protein